MDAKSINSFIKTTLTPQNLIVLICVGAFLPFIFSAVIDIIAILLILFYPKFQRGLFAFKGASVFPIFAVYAAAVAVFNRNLKGLILVPIVFGILLIFCFVKVNMTQETFDFCLTAVSFTVFPAFLFALFEVIGSADIVGKYVYRTASYFGNANYFGAMMAAIVIIAGHNIIKKKGRTIYYFAVAIMGLVNIYLSGSLFAIVEIIVGGAIYLLLSKHYRLFCLMIIVGATAIVTITAVPGLLPRLSESSATTSYRVRMWGVIIEQVKNHPIFGGGFMSYGMMKDLYDGSYYAFHGHNFMMDTLANFGIVGTLIVFAMLYVMLRGIVQVYVKDKNSYIAIFAASIAFAVAVHTFTDLVFFWIQTGVFYAIVFGSIGAEERRLGIAQNPMIMGKIRL